MKLIDVIAQWIPGDWGNEQTSVEAPIAVHCIRSADIAPIYQYSFDTAVIRYISEKSLSKCQLSEGDIIVEKSGGTDTCSTGRVIFVTKEILEKNTPLVCSNFCSAFKVKDGWNAKYIYYYLQLIHKSGVFHNFEGKTSGIHNLLINAAYSSIDIPEISYTEQCRVVDVLSTIESEIALNHCINDQLEQTARDLYDYWFLQFDFPDANGNPYRTSGGAMTYNATLKREIPVGWEVKELKDVLTMYQPQTIPMDDLSDDLPYKVYGANGLIGHYGKYNHEESEIAMACRGNSCGVVNRVPRKAWITGNAMVMHMKDERITNEFFALSVPYINVKGVITGSGQPQITRENLNPVKILWPSEKLLLKFTAEVTHLIEQQLHLIDEIDRLCTLRDQLLPLLMNGQVTIE